MSNNYDAILFRESPRTISRTTHATECSMKPVPLFEVNAKPIVLDQFSSNDMKSHEFGLFLENDIFNGHSKNQQEYAPFRDPFNNIAPRFSTSTTTTTSNLTNQNHIYPEKSVFDIAKNEDDPSLKNSKYDINKNPDLFKDFAVTAFNEFKRDFSVTTK